MKSNQLSQIAAFVAVKFYGLTREEQFQSLFDDSIISFYDRLVSSLPAPIRYYHFWLRFGWIRKFYTWSEELLLPGDLLHVIGRKWYIQRMAQELVDHDYEQMIVLGAGFDHLGHYFSQRDITCVECDAPYMTELKQTFLDEHYPDSKHPIILATYLPGDQLDTIFSDEQQIHPDKKTMIIAEGFFDYLDKKTVSNCLQQINRYFSHSPALISTHFALDELSAFHRSVFRRSVQIVGERLQFETGMDGFRQLLSSCGFEIKQLHDSHAIRDILCDKVDTTLSILDGFYIFRAE